MAKQSRCVSIKRLRLAISLLFLVFLPFFNNAQTVVIAFQGFEENASDTWSYLPPTQNSAIPQVIVGAGNYGAAYVRTGSRSMRFGGGSTTCGGGSSNCLASSGGGGNCTNNPNGTVVEFAPADIKCYEAVTISIAYRTHVLCGGEGQGFDSGDRVHFEASINGGGFTPVATVNGTNNCQWTYTTNPVTCAGPPVANPFVYNVPAGSNTVAFRVRIQINRSDEILYIDDVTLSGSHMSVTTTPIYHN